MKNHPKGLVILFFTEMWERFSYYGMRSLLVLYLTLELFRDIADPAGKTIAYGIYAAYAALVYATPFIGGLLADRYMGHKRAVMWGAILMAVGHFVMAIENEFFLYIALSFIILGNGFFKPNMSTLVGSLYGKRDKRRDAGFTIFYMGVNLGAFFSPIVCGAIGEIYGWHYGFGIAGIGMLAGLFVFHSGRTHLQGVGELPEAGKKTIAGIRLLTPINIIYTSSLVVIALFAFMIRNYEIMAYVLTPFSIIIVIILIVYALGSVREVRERMFVILILLFFNMLFIAFFEQAGSSLTLYTNESVDRSFFSWEIPASLFQSVNPLFILIFAPMLSILWVRLGQTNKEPSTPMKFAIGLFTLGVGFYILDFALGFVHFEPKQNVVDGIEILSYVAVVPMVFLILAYLLHTLGELCLQPIGLSMISKLASPKIVGMVMGAWFLSFSMAHHLAGVIAKFTSDTGQAEYIEYVMSELTLDLDDYYLSESDVAILSQSIEASREVVYSGLEKIGMSQPRIADSTIDNAVNTVVVGFYNASLQSQITEPQLRIILKPALERSIQIIINDFKASFQQLKNELGRNNVPDNLKFRDVESYSKLSLYTEVFKVVGIIAMAASLLLVVLVPFLKRLMHGAD